MAISHEHLDHLDLPLLAALPEHVRVVVPRYPSPILRQRLDAAGVKRVIELDAWERLPLNTRGDWMTVIPEQSPMCHDAAILVVASGHALMHTNDARLSLTQARRAMAEVGGPLDFMAVQMSGASWHPICYEYPEAMTARISAEKRAVRFKAVTRLLRGAQPGVVMPCAGPPCFLDDALRAHNAWIPAPGIFPDLAQAKAGWTTGCGTKLSSPCCRATGSTWAAVGSSRIRTGRASPRTISRDIWTRTPIAGPPRSPLSTPRTRSPTRRALWPSGSRSTSGA